MLRWGLRHIFRKVSADDFKLAVASMKESFENNHGPASLEIQCYTGIKQSITIDDDGLNAFLDQENKKIMSVSLDNIDKLTPEIWDKTRYIEAHIRPQMQDRCDTSYTYVEAKGTLLDTMNFYAQGPDQMVVETKRALISKHNPLWKKTDGQRSNHTVSMS